MDVPKEYRNILVFRALIGYTGIQGLWASVKYIHLSTASSIFFTMPIWSAIFAWIFINERINIMDIVSVVCAFIGMLIVNNPWEETAEESAAEKSDIAIGTIFALSGAIGGSFAVLCMRHMRNMHYGISPFWFASGCTFLSMIVHSLQLNNSYYKDGELDREKTTTVYDTKTAVLIGLASVFSFFGQVFGSRSF
jgi:drug/metabolite transporter (DMT)-like permease